MLISIRSSRGLLRLLATTAAALAIISPLAVLGAPLDTPSSNTDGVSLDGIVGTQILRICSEADN